MTTTPPAVATPWTPDDERIRTIRHAMLTTEETLGHLRMALDDAIDQRRATVPDDRFVCPVCGRVVPTVLPGVNFFDKHPSDRGSQCRGTGLPTTQTEIGGGL